MRQRGIALSALDVCLAACGEDDGAGDAPTSLNGSTAVADAGTSVPSSDPPTTAGGPTDDGRADLALCAAELDLFESTFGVSLGRWSSWTISTARRIAGVPDA